jgi:predicted transcriptional regulator
MSTATEKATAYLLKLQADRAAALAASEEKLREAMLIKAREDGFRDAMEIFNLTITSNDIESEPVKTRRGRRRDIRQLIIKELSFSGKSMTQRQIAKAINYIPEGTEAALKRLETAGIVQNRDGYWEAVVTPAVESNAQAPHQGRAA